LGINFVKIVKFVFTTSDFVIMDKIFSEKAYDEMIGKLFVRFPSFQKTGASAYKPGIGNMEFFDQLAGHPHRQYRTIHIAGTNGKGSVAAYILSVLEEAGLETGFYTSPSLTDFSERIRINE
jgi:dihydrofolate synthase/folylpolyglutamate synthase